MICQTRKPRKKGQRGQVLIMATLSLTLTFAVLGLAVDVGWSHFRKQSAYAAAQSAAIAGARAAMFVADPSCGGGLTCQSTPTACPGALTPTTNPVVAACLYAQQNGFTNGVNSHNVLIADNTIGAPVPGVTPAFWISATVSERQPLTFLSVLGQQFVTVAARSTAGVVGGDNCVYALDPTQAGAISNQNAITSACGIIADSSNAQGIQAGPGITAPSVGVVGGYNGTIHSSNITTGMTPVSDPLAYIPAPSTAGACLAAVNFSSGTHSIGPGKYCGGITLSGTATLNLSSGTYILMGGGLNMTGNATLNGTGVTLYNTFDATHPYAPIFNQDNIVLNLIAPTSGTYSGILFFNDRAITSTADNIIGGASEKLQGSLYFPTTPLNFSSGSWVPVAYTIVVAKTITNQINGLTINNDYSSLSNGSPIKAIAIYE